MTTYEITFTNNNTGRTKIDRFTEANEAAAKKAFKECYRHDDYTIESVVPVAEGVQASKEQERKALDQIKAIVATLGENSYIGTALTGCLEDAADNIENDFACSMYDRLQSSDALLTKTSASLTAANDIIAEKDRRIAELEKQVSEDRQHSISKQDLSYCTDLANNALIEAERNGKRLASAIVEYADNPTSVEFRNAVDQHRQNKRVYDCLFGLIGRLCDVIPTGE